MKRTARSTRGRKKSTRGVVALLTDFGDSDHYAATLKAVILTINPLARIVDISHNVSPQNVQQAGYLLWASYQFFPDGTVFACVVDPGVGSERKIICLQTDRHAFIAPDNGLLDMVAFQENIRRSYEIVYPPRISSTPISATFHGRDIFAPLAGVLSLGKSVGQFGKLYDLKKPSSMFYDSEKGTTTARILHIDHFGNLITNIPERYYGHCTIEVGGTRISTRIRNYAEAPKNQSCIIVGSNRLIEIVLKEGSAAAMLGVTVRTPITVSIGDQSPDF
jgi:S-adenosylmethionine hydrolase